MNVRSIAYLCLDCLIIFNARLRVLMLGLFKLRRAVCKSCFIFGTSFSKRIK